MKKSLLLCVIILSSVSLKAQAGFTNITGQAIDSTGQIYANGSWQASFVQTPGITGPYLVNGQPFQQNFAGPLDSNGRFTVTVADNTIVRPGGSQWTFTVCPNATFQCSEYTATVAGVTLDITPGLTQFMKPMTGAIKPSPINSAYQDAQIAQAIDGNIYFNTTNSIYRVWYNGAWNNVAGGGIGGGGIQTINGMNNAAQTITGSGGVLVSFANGNTNITLAGPGPPVLNAISFNPASVLGGSNSTGTASLTSAAPTGGALVTLSSSNTGVVTVPASVTVAANATSATFTATTVAVSSNTTVTVTGNYSGTKTGNLTVTVPQPIYGGVGQPGATATVTLSGTHVILSTGDSLGTLQTTPEAVGQSWTFSPNNQCVYLLLFGGSHTFTDASTGLTFAFNPPIAVSVNGISMYLYQSTNQLFGTSRPKVAN